MVCVCTSFACLQCFGQSLEVDWLNEKTAWTLINLKLQHISQADTAKPQPMAAPHYCKLQRGLQKKVHIQVSGKSKAYLAFVNRHSSHVRSSYDMHALCSARWPRGDSAGHAAKHLARLRREIFNFASIAQVSVFGLSFSTLHQLS